jgi:hypothetical protein
MDTRIPLRRNRIRHGYLKFKPSVAETVPHLAGYTLQRLASFDVTSIGGVGTSLNDSTIIEEVRIVTIFPLPMGIMIPFLPKAVPIWRKQTDGNLCKRRLPHGTVK